ncbi:MAG: polysaccharide deacetylase family protein [Solirubrobacteraceae bacterium]
MIRHALAPVLPAAAAALAIPRTLSGAGTSGAGLCGARTSGARSARARAAVAITFDDGPHPEGTPAILEILAGADARATFFVIGEQVQRRPELAQRILDEGHALALHGHRHRLQLRLTSAQLQSDLRLGAAAIEDATGTTVLHHRPPYGIYSAAGLRAVRERGMRPLLWSTWGKDWRKLTTPERIAARVNRALAPGAVILLHDADFYSARHAHERTARALPLILTELKSRELATVPVI